MANKEVVLAGGNEDYELARIKPEALRAIFKDNVGNDGVGAFDLPRVKIPAAGGQSWTVPTLEGDTTSKVVRGIIVHQRDVRSYWKEKFGETPPGTPPSCSSEDGITGHGMPGGCCGTCPLNEWGSAGDGKKGKACRQVKMIFLVQPDEFMPIVMVLAPTSIPATKKYFLLLSSRALSYHNVITEFILERAQSGGGIAYSRAVPRMVRKLTPEEHTNVAQNAATIKQALQAVRFDDPEDYAEHA